MSIDKLLLKQVIRELNSGKVTYIEQFTSKPKDIQEEIIELIYQSQAISIRKGIEEKNDIKLSILGTLKIKQSSFEIRAYSDKLLKEYGVISKSKLTSASRKEYEDKMREKVKTLILKRKGVL
jgi:hypothetical protein